MSQQPGAGRSQRPPGPLRLAATAAARFDVAAVSFGAAARATTGCVVVLAVALAVVGDAGAAAATVGALLAGIPSLSPTARRPLATMGATTCGIALSTFVGSATAHIAGLHFGLLVAWAFTGGLLVALGDTGSVVGTQATMAFIVFGRFAEPVGTAGRLGGYVAIGGAFQMLLAAGARWPVALLPQRRSLAEAYRLLAALALGGPQASSLPAEIALDTAEAALVSPTLVRRRDVSALRGLADEGRRLRIELAALEALQLQLPRVASPARQELGGAVERALVQMAFVLRYLAEAIDGKGEVEVSTAALDLAVRDAAQAAESIAASAPTVTFGATSDGAGPAVAAALSGHLAALAGQLRAAAILSDEASTRARATAHGRRRRLASGTLERVRAQAALLRANVSLRSTACRHAIRLALVVPVAELVSAHTPLERGYWVPLTAALVLRPDFGSTLTRSLARFAGTIVGVGITGVIVAGGHLSGVPAVVIIATLAFCGFSSFRASYAAYTVFLTGLVVLLVNLATPGAHSTLATALDRLIDTFIGGGLALVVYVLWPTWTTDEARESLAGLVADEANYLDAVLADLSGRKALGDGDARNLARKLRLSRTNCEALVARSLAEPHAHRLDGALAAGMLASLRRLGLTTHVLRTSFVGMPGRGAAPEIEPLRRALAEALGLVAAELRGGPAARLPPLRQIHTGLAGELERRDGGQLLIVETDEIVDAVDTLAALVDSRPAVTELE